MKASAATAPTSPIPALRLDAAPVLSGRLDLVAVGEPVALYIKLLGTVSDLLGITMLELPAGAPVLRTG